MKDLLGGKGSGLAEMTNAGLPVPPGFTITTAACNLYYELGRKVPAEVEQQMEENLRKLEKTAGQQFGSVQNPLLVSVRSGAKFSMPGMMDTILNLGLNDETVEGLKARTGNGRFAYDSYRRFMQMFGNVVLEIPKEEFEKEFDAVKHEQRREARHRPRRAGAARGREALQGASSAQDRQGLPVRPDGAAARRAERRLPLVEQPARQVLPRASTTSPTTSAPPSTCS